VANAMDGSAVPGEEDTDHLMAHPFRTNDMDCFLKSHRIGPREANH
jgi:hypothetical protein